MLTDMILRNVRWYEMLDMRSVFTVTVMRIPVTWYVLNFGMTVVAAFVPPEIWSFPSG